MTQAAPVLTPSDRIRLRPTRGELLALAVSSGAVARFIHMMGGPPEFDGCDEDDIRDFIRENAP